MFFNHATCKTLLKNIWAGTKQKWATRFTQLIYSWLTAENRNFHIGKPVLCGKLEKPLPDSLSNLHHSSVSGICFCALLKQGRRFATTLLIPNWFWLLLLSAIYPTITHISCSVFLFESSTFFHPVRPSASSSSSIHFLTLSSFSSPLPYFITLSSPHR